MIALMVVGIILFVLFLIGQIRLGIVVEYSEAGLFVIHKIGPAKVTLFPAKGRKKEEKKDNSDSTPEKAKGNLKDTLTVANKFFPLIGDAAGRLRRKIRIDDLFLKIIWANSDPAAAAMGYGAANAAMGVIWPIIEHNFRVKRYDLHIDVDFEGSAPSLELRAKTTLTCFQLFAFSLHVGVKALKIYLGIRRDKSQEQAVQV